MKTIEAFHQRHGDFVEVGGMLFFQDGASRENDANGVLLVPPESPYELAKIQRIFWAEKLWLAVDAFDYEKRALLGDAKARLQRPGNVGGPPCTIEDGVRLLTELQGKAEFCKKNLDEVEAELEASKPRATELAKIEEQNRRALEDFVGALKKITI